MTNQELEAIERKVLAIKAGSWDASIINDVLRLVSEVRRLRAFDDQQAIPLDPKVFR